jgi:hypothetical protein
MGGERFLSPSKCGYPHNINGISIYIYIYQWDINGISMVYQWYINGISMVYPYIYGIYHES